MISHNSNPDVRIIHLPPVYQSFDEIAFVIYINLGVSAAVLASGRTGSGHCSDAVVAPGSGTVLGICGVCTLRVFQA